MVKPALKVTAEAATVLLNAENDQTIEHRPQKGGHAFYARGCGDASL